MSSSGDWESNQDLLGDMYQELDLVFNRYSDLCHARPDMVAAVLVNMMDTWVQRYDVDVAITQHLDEDGDEEPVVTLEFEHDEYGAVGFLGVERDFSTGAITDDRLDPDAVKQVSDPTVKLENQEGSS